MKLKILKTLSCFIIGILLLAGCGASTQEDQSNEQEIQDVGQQDVENGDAENTKAQGNKKIVVVQEGNDETRLATQKNMIKALEDGGYKKDENTEIIEIVMESNPSSGNAVVERIKELKPDVVLVNALVYAGQTVAQPLNDLGINTVINVYGENFVDENGLSKGSVTGVYSMPKNMQAKAFQLLEKISPSNGKKAVFITQEGAFSKEDVEKNLKAINVQLKEYVNYKYVEEYKEAIEKYNNDDEVAWVLIGIWAMQKKDGTVLPIEAAPRGEIIKTKKPTVTYWENGVSWGMLCGLGVDLPTTGTQAGETAVKILNGEDIKTIKAVEPTKVNIVLNKKSADDLHIEIPADILGSAYRVYTDFEGKYMGQ